MRAITEISLIVVRKYRLALKVLLRKPTKEYEVEVIIIKLFMLSSC